MSELLLGATALAFACTGMANAQTVVPPTSGPCVVAGTTATCTGDVSAGVQAGTPLTNLNVNSLNQDIAPAAGVNGISFVSPGDVTITSDTGNFQTTVNGANTRGILGGSFGGNVIISNTGNVSNNGANSAAVVGQADNGNSTVTQIGDVVSSGVSGIGVVSFAPSGFSTLNYSGNVATSGDLGTAILVFGNAGADVSVTGTARTTGNDASAIQVSGVFGLAGGGLANLELNADVTTTGTGSVGVVLQGGTGATANITGAVQATGANADAILAATITGDVSLNLTDASITSAQADGIEICCGTNNTITVNNTVSVSGQTNDILGSTGNETITNNGTLTTPAIIDLGGGANAFNNSAGALFNSGTQVNLGAGNLITNDGTMSPGGIGTLQTTVITGNLVQSATGTYQADVDPSAGTGDLVSVTGTANLAGTVQANAVNPTPGTHSVRILTAAGGTTNNGLDLAPTGPALTQLTLTFPNANDVFLNYAIDFIPTGLNRNQRQIAAALNSAAANGQGALNPILTALVNGISTLDGYRAALDQLLPEIYLNTQTASLFASEDFIENLFSCRQAGENHTALSEGSCAWARPRGKLLERDRDAETIGFEEKSGRIAVGGQMTIAPNWFAGVGFGYEIGRLSMRSGADSDSSRFNAGVALKYQKGPWLLASALSAGVADFDTTRSVRFGGFVGTANSDHSIVNVASQVRVAHLVEHENWFAKPFVDFNVTHFSRGNARETGNPAITLDVAGSDTTVFSVTPGLEFGGDIALSETMTLRPHARLGVTHYSDTDHGLTARFFNAPAGSTGFVTTTEFDEVFADITAGATAFFDNGTSLALTYEGLISSDIQQHGISLTARIPL